jgi:putative flippase GtrA
LGKVPVFKKRKKVIKPLNMNEGTHTKAGIFGGTLTILLTTINGSDVMKTVLMTSIGAVVSFIISHALKKLISWWKKPPGSLS